MLSEDVVITGCGVVSPLGLTAPSTWAALRAGAQSGQLIDLFETEGCRVRRGAQAPLPAPTKAERRLSRASRLAIRAASEAFAQAGLSTKELPICVSTTGGAMEWGEDFLRDALRGRRLRQLARLARYQPQQQVLDVQRALGVNGPMTILGNACASGANAIGHAYDLIRAGMSPCVLAGGYEALSEMLFLGFDCLLTLSPDLCRPFDVKRNGLMLGEGAAFMVLESATHARERGAEILGRVRGYGHSVDLHHLTQPAPDGRALAAAIRGALQDAALEPREIAYLNAHGTGTAFNDAAEVVAYREVFGATLPSVAISSTKAAIGHTLAAAGSLEAVFAVCAARDGMAPRQLNVTTPMPEIADSLVGAQQKITAGAPVMSVNLGFGGSNAALVLST